ncbi:hypothetical protein Acy02nite_72300 [Actinoplanes cyaneus]|uniref:Uncharacterized protein n=1 Tax=Actinoplanes cyaneus TaxID=52696 RepID=A0A919MB80_9ACTN|nr:hypothetical protein Acy02nite_72300 [Actinoplanes cyaneus]
MGCGDRGGCERGHAGYREGGSDTCGSVHVDDSAPSTPTYPMTMSDWHVSGSDGSIPPCRNAVHRRKP